MTTRALTLVWLSAIVISVLAAMLLTGLAKADRSSLIARTTQLIADERADIVVIGSSVLRYAIPPRSAPGPAGRLLGDGRAHVRLGVTNLSEAQTIALTRTALSAGATSILVEINALGFDFARLESDTGFAPADRLYAAVRRVKRGVRAGARVLLKGPGAREPATQARKIDRRFSVSQRTLKYLYPLRLHPPRNIHALKDVLDMAREAGCEIILIAPPRSQTAASYMGADAVAALDSHLAALAASLGVPLFSPGPVWPDRVFIDQAHVNREGRARFTAELANWYEARLGARR